MIGMDRVAGDDNEDEDIQEQGIEDRPPGKLVELGVIDGLNSSDDECNEGNNPCGLNLLACRQS